ncbi:hypothetical protein H310_10961 [Aphanomyces invadans]|uniref:RWD domain-containing protein n=1 Tax=Aphanomyces invadans TaxID=157072 RepID=A0A024TPE6_9STRA|nr:hypothetical protein H310_10961 [Aphanomyces invadans]ETV95491.1 hypothetical protein H310_10961 [Aphanomyces invadans]|eukprot:XP_008875684.1 hypothetical protein H310_10961 [Aphanomyces invadans]
MTDYVEEQMMEVEALESIYMDDFTKVQESPLSLKVRLIPDQTGGVNHVAMSLVFTMPAKYPDELPSVDIKLEKGLSEPQERDIRALVNQQMEDNTGIAMVYTVCEAVREYLIENNREGNDGSEYQEMLRRQEQRQKKDTIAAEAAQAVLEKEAESKGVSKPSSGTPVTVESFNAWKAAFDLEMATKSGAKIAVGAEKRLTGRQLWTTGAAKEATEADSEVQSIDGSAILDDDGDDIDDEDYVDEGDDDNDDNE